MNDAFFDGFVEVAVDIAVGFSARTFGEDFQGTPQAALGFAVANGSFFGCTDALFG